MILAYQDAIRAGFTHFAKALAAVYLREFGVTIPGLILTDGREDAQ